MLHIHKNVPGVLAQVNERLSAAGINIAAQYLSTNEEVDAGHTAAHRFKAPAHAAACASCVPL